MKWKESFIFPSKGIKRGGL